MSAPFDYLPLAELPEKLKAHDVSVTYHQCWRRASEGRIQAYRFGRDWFVAKSDLQAIASSFLVK